MAAKAKRPRSGDDEEEEKSLSIDEPSDIPKRPIKRQRGGGGDPSVGPNPGFMPRPNESFFAGPQDPLNTTQQATGPLTWDPIDVERGRARNNIGIYEEKRTFDSLIQEMERDFDEKISRKVREHPLYDYCVMVIGALGRGNQQMNPNLVFDTQEAKQLADSIISNMKLAMEIKLDLQRQHTMVFENKQLEENKIISKYRSLEKDERFYQRCITYLARILDFSTSLPQESLPSDKLFHSVLGIDIAEVFEALDSYQTYAQKLKRVDAVMDAYYKQSQREEVRNSEDWKARTSLGRIEKAIHEPYKTQQGAATPPNRWINAIFEQFSREEQATIAAAFKARDAKFLTKRRANDGFEQDYQLAFIMTYMALPQLLISSGLSGTALDGDTRLNIELFCDIVHKTLSMGSISKGKVDDYNTVLREFTGKTYFMSETTEVSMGSDKSAGSPESDIKKLTMINKINLTDSKFHKEKVVDLALELIEVVLNIGVKKGANTAAKLSLLLKGFTSQLADIDNRYRTEDKSDVDPSKRLEPVEIVERRLKMSQYYIAAQFTRPLLTWSYPFISDGASLLDHAKGAASPDLAAAYIDRTAVALLQDMYNPLASVKPSLDFFDAADLGKGNLAAFVPEVVDFETENKTITTEMKHIKTFINTATMENMGRGDPSKTDLIDINTLEDTSVLLDIDGLGDVRSILVFYDKLHTWLNSKKETFEAQLINTRQRVQQVKNEARRMRIFLGAEGEERPRPDQTEEETQAEKVIDEAFDERSKKMQAAIGAAVIRLEQGDGIKVRSDINYASERAFTELARLNPSWARHVGSWERIGQSRNLQARALLSAAVASIINESQVVSGTRGSYLQLDIRTFNLANSAYALQSLLQISSFMI